MTLYRKFLKECIRDYHIRIKTVTEMTDENMDKLEFLLQKYDVQSVDGPRKTVIQEHPLDFYDVINQSVYIIDVVLGLPASSYMLQQEIKETLDIPEKFVVVRADNDPLEMETQKLNAQALMDENKDGPAAKLSTDPEYPEQSPSAEELYGDKYNENFVSRLAQAQSKVESGNAMDLNNDLVAPMGNMDEDGNDVEFITDKGRQGIKTDGIR